MKNKIKHRKVLQILNKLNLSENARAETLSIEDFANIAKLISK